jgi:hypothetical protein
MKQRKRKEKKQLTLAQGSRDAMEDFGSLPSSSDFVPFTPYFRSSSPLLYLSLFWFSARGLFSMASSVSLRRNREKTWLPFVFVYSCMLLSQRCFFFFFLYIVSFALLYVLCFPCFFSVYSPLLVLFPRLSPFLCF